MPALRYYASLEADAVRPSVLVPFAAAMAAWASNDLGLRWLGARSTQPRGQCC